MSDALYTVIVGPQRTERFKSARRYYLAMRRYNRDIQQTALELTWRGKQEAEPGTPLPDGFPFRERLIAEGYEADTDLDGADAEELVDVGFGQREAEQILAALTST